MFANLREKERESGKKKSYKEKSEGRTREKWKERCARSIFFSLIFKETEKRKRINTLAILRATLHVRFRRDDNFDFK